MISYLLDLSLIIENIDILWTLSSIQFFNNGGGGGGGGENGGYYVDVSFSSSLG